MTILRRLWTEEHVSHEGRFYQFHGLTLEPKPLQKPCPPIWIATNPKPELTRPQVMDRALRRVGLTADGWMTDNTPAARFKERWELIRRVAREAGRPTESMESALHLMVNINDDPRAAFEEAVKFLHTYYSPAMTREYIEGWLAYGPPAAVVEKIRAYVDAAARRRSYDSRRGIRRVSWPARSPTCCRRRARSACPPDPRRQLGIQAVTVISTRSSGEFSAADTVVRAGLLVGKYFAYSSL